MAVDAENTLEPLPFQQVSHPVNQALDRYTVLLRDGETTATIYPITSAAELPIDLLVFLCDEFNMEIERGDTMPFYSPMGIEAFQNYWFSGVVGVMLLGRTPIIHNRNHWEKECLGTFFLTPSYPDRCKSICTGNFLVNAGIRGKGIGRTMVECYLDWAQRLGYTFSLFNLVYDTNVAARRVFEVLKYKRVGRIPSGAMLKNMTHAVDILMLGRELQGAKPDEVGEMRFDRIKYYLETGKYPPDADRQEKSRLRSSSAHYRLRDGRLMLKDREVISDPSEQLKIVKRVHNLNHSGINKTTSMVAERYHWARIKDTAALAIRDCARCRDTNPTRNKRQKPDDDNPENVEPAPPSLALDADLHDEILKFNADEGMGLQRFSYRPSFSAQTGIPVDPEVQSAFDEHVHEGEEIAIARALIQANGDRMF